MSDTAEILVVGGQRFWVQGALDEVEGKILAAARGSILELVRFTESESGDAVALNPAHIVAVRDARPRQSPPG